jgi:hypothetical protein
MHRRGADTVAEFEQLAPDPHVPPARVLPRHLHNQGYEDVLDRGRPARFGLGPSSADEAAPAQDCVRGDQALASQCSRPVEFQNLPRACDQRFQAAASYWLMRPPRIGRRRILP